MALVKCRGLTSFSGLLSLTYLWRDRCWRLLLTVLQFCFFSTIKHSVHREESLCAYHVRLEPVIAEKWLCRSLRQLILHQTHSHEQGEVNMCSLVLSSLTQSRPSLGRGAGHSSWVFLHQLAIKTIFHKYAQRPISSRKFLNGNLLADEFRLLQINSKSYKITHWIPQIELSPEVPLELRHGERKLLFISSEMEVCTKRGWVPGCALSTAQEDGN